MRTSPGPDAVSLWLFAVGAAALLGQVVLLRELEVAFRGSELVLVLGLGAWLLGTAAGALSGRRGHVPGERAVRRLLVTLGVVVPLSVVLARGVRLLFGAVAGAYLPFGRQMLATAVCLLPAAFLLGLLFRWTAKRFVETGRSPAAAYAIESTGGVAGGLLATLLLAAGVPNWSAALLCALGVFVVAARSGSRGDRSTGLAAVLGAALALAALLNGPGLDRRMTAWNHPRLLGTRDTPYGRVTVTDRLGQVAVFESDALAFESEGTAAEEFVHLAAVQRVAPRRVLILGGGAQGLVPEVLKHRPGAVEDLELDARALALAVGHQPEALRRALADGRVRVRITDPRRDIESHRHRDASGVAAVDLILVGMPEPESGRANRYYTREFFAACARRLAPEGVLALRLKSAENLWTPVLARRAAGIRQALLESFPHVVVLPGATNVLLASRVPLERDPEVLGERLRARGIEARLVTPAYVRYLYTNDRFSEVERLLERTRARANSDAQPSCYQATMLLWLARFFPRLGRVDLPEPEVSSVTGSPWIWAGAVAIAGLLLWSRRRGALRRALLAGLAGFAGMLLEAVLLLRYQAGSGVLYQNLGVLLTMFMAGLALGARGTEILRGLGALGLAALLILGLAGACLPGAAVGGFGVAALLLLACGASVGAAFAFSVLQGNPDAKAAVGPVYAADLAGGCAGSLIAGLVTIPMLGLSATSGLAAVVAVAALLLV